MLDVALERAVIARKDFRLELSVRFPREAHTIVSGLPGSGKSTLLEAIAGELPIESGKLLIGARDATKIRGSQRPLLFRRSDLPHPARWSVAHVLLAALRNRKLDRDDRMTQLEEISANWDLAPVLERRLDSLGSTLQTKVQCAELEALRPAVLLLDRFFERCDAAEAATLAESLFRMLRSLGTTVINVPARLEETGFAERQVVIGEGRLLQEGSPSEVYYGATSIASAAATGLVAAVPVTVKRGTVSSVIGEWDAPQVTFEGSGVALIRPTSVEAAAHGEESDFIFSVDEAWFSAGEWLANGYLTGNIRLVVKLAAGLRVRKGMLVPMRLVVQRIALVPSDAPAPAAPVSLLPPRELTR